MWIFIFKIIFCSIPIYQMIGAILTQLSWKGFAADWKDNHGYDANWVEYICNIWGWPLWLKDYRGWRIRTKGINKIERASYRL